MNSVKDDVRALLDNLPDTCSVEDVQYQLFALDKIRKGLKSLDTEPTLSQEEAKMRLSKWLTG